MKISLNWLKKYISLSESPEDISQVLTDIGLEVEGLDEVEGVPGGLKGVVVAQVTKCVQHPNADRLKLCQVNTGNEEVQIVCGAPNVAEGQKVLLATEGTTLYPAGSDEPLKIKKGKIRGEVSQGMICAEDELGLGGDHDGIMVLPATAKLGQAASEYLQLESDYTFEIGLTPNRVDAASHIGVARDLAAFYGKKVEWPSVKEFKASSSTGTKVTVADEKLCPRYMGINMDKIQVKDSPDWLKKALLSIGLKPINNVVDVSNYVLHETGQPLHFFDRDKISGDHILVKTLKEGTAFTTLDGVERKLNANDLMICDENGALCLAGVFGGLSSGVTNSTKSIFIESASFDAVSVRKSSKRHNLNTDASFRFERGTDPYATEYALKRAVMLLEEVAGAKVSSAISDFFPTKPKPYAVTLRLEQLKTIAGMDIPTQKVKDILTGLEINIVKESKESLDLEVPLWRVDVQREIDVMEEIFRIFGYNNIPFPEKLNASLVVKKGVDGVKLKENIANMLSSLGFNEMMANSLTSFEENKKAGFISNEEVLLANPLSNELNLMRQTLLSGALDAVAYNLNRKQGEIRLFEFGNTYQRKGEGFGEDELLSLCLAGRRNSKQWNAADAKMEVFYLKSFLEAVLNKLGYNELHHEEVEVSYFEHAVSIGNGNYPLAVFGRVKEKVLQQYEIKEPVFYAEVNWQKILKKAKNKGIAFSALSPYPAVERDISLLIDEQVSFEQLRNIAVKTERKILQKVSAFDVYKGKNVPEGKKSYALNFLLQDASKTLNDAQIDATMNKLMKAFESELGAEIRK